MAITTYSELKTAAANWLHRAGLTDRIVEFVALAESNLNRDLRLRAMVNTDNITVTASSATASLPTGFLSVIEFTDDDYNPIVPVTQAEYLRMKTTDTGKPEYYTLDSGITFECPSDAAYTYLMRYYKAWDIATDTTNWLLTNSPNVYLYATLAEASPFLKDMAQAQAWMALRDDAIKDVIRNDRRSTTMPTLRVDAALYSTGRANIETDR